MRAALLIIACAALGACAATPQPRDQPRPRNPGECNPEAAQHLIGSKATADVGADLLRLTHATALRWVPPRTAVTMDFRADRLTVPYDDDMVITRISCT